MLLLLLMTTTIDATCNCSPRAWWDACLAGTPVYTVRAFDDDLHILSSWYLKAIDHVASNAKRLGIKVVVFDHVSCVAFALLLMTDC
jgi:hypothetical protein